MKRTFLAILLALGLAACGGSSGTGNADGGTDGGTDGGMGDTDFTAFVKQQLAATSNSTDPVCLDEITFDTTNEDETAYDDILQAP